MPSRTFFGLVKGLIFAALLCGSTQLVMGQAASGSVWKDNATGLTWTLKDNDADVNFGQAQQYCSSLKLGGLSDWRLPTIDELSAIYDAKSTKQFKTKGPIELSGLVILSGSTNDSGDVWSFYFSYGGKSLARATGTAARRAPYVSIPKSEKPFTGSRVNAFTRCEALGIIHDHPNDA